MLATFPSSLGARRGRRVAEPVLTAQATGEVTAPVISQPKGGLWACWIYSKLRLLNPYGDLITG